MIVQKSNDLEYFGTADFVVFGGSLLICAGVGIFFAVKDRNKGDAENYYFGGKRMSPVAIGISLVVSFISAITVIGSPTETYLYGTVAMWFPLAYVLPTMVAVLYYIPMLHRLQMKTIYEYLEMRFNSNFRKLMSALEFLSMLTYMCFALLVPALALNVVTPISLHWSIVLTSAVCTLYTAVGGIKAVIWTDVIQFMFMLTGSVLTLALATAEVDGFSETWSALRRGGRLNFFDFNPNPTIRSTFWTLVVGVSITECFATCTNQATYQRYLACRTVAGAKRAALITLLPKTVLCLLAYLSGCVAYAYFEGCDPVASGAISKSDQMFPYLVLNVLSGLPGTAGLFVAAAFSAAMSTISSGLNSMSAQLLEDFLIPLRPNLNSSYRNAFSRLASVFLGVMITGIAYLLMLLEGTVISTITSIRGGLIGAVLGVYTLGMFFPWCNTKGAMAGQLIGFAASTWLGIGGIVYGRSPATQRKLPVSTLCCNVTRTTCLSGNFSLVDPYLVEAHTMTSVSESQEYSSLYAVSVWYLSGIGLLITVVIGLLVSMLTGPNEPSKSDPRLFCPFIDNRLLPQEVRKFFRFGVPEKSSEHTLGVSRNDEDEFHVLKPDDPPKSVECAAFLSTE